MPVLRYANLEDVRIAIDSRHLISFLYRKKRILAEPHLLGQARKTRAYVLVAWTLQPAEEWQYFRYSEIRDLEVQVQRFTGIRSGFNPHDGRIIGIDTLIRGCRS